MNSFRDPSQIKNKIKRNEIVRDQKQDKRKLKDKLRKISKKSGEERKEPITIEMKRIIQNDLILNDDLDLNDDEICDEFSSFIAGQNPPKILLTTNERPSVKTFEILQDLKNMIPNCFFYPRKKFTLIEVAKQARDRNFTHVLTVNERLKQPYSLNFTVLGDSHQTAGPTIVYRLRKFVASYDIHHKGNPSGYQPELIFKNFNTALGRRVSRGFASLFNPNPEFRGRTVVTFHNQRDFVFVRNHRYVFKKGEAESEDEDADDQKFKNLKKEDKLEVHLQEIGPRFVLQLNKVYSGCFDEVYCQNEFVYHGGYYVDRNRFYL